MNSDPTAKQFIIHLNNEMKGAIIIESLDDTDSVFIKREYVGMVQKKLNELMDKNTFEPVDKSDH